MSDSLQLVPLEIVLGHNFPVAIRATKSSEVAGDRFRQVPDTGLTLTGFLSATKDAAATAIHSDVSVSLVEVGSTGYYYAEILGANITARLGAYVDVDTPVYLIVTQGSALRASTECRVKSSGAMLVAP